MIDIFGHAIKCEQRYQMVSKGCTVCGKKFKFNILRKGAAYLKAHMQTAHSSFCNFCQETFNYKEEFKIHMTEKHEETFCILCLKYFSPEELIKHKKELHYCDICQETLETFVSAHMNYHHRPDRGRYFGKRVKFYFSRHVWAAPGKNF